MTPTTPICAASVSGAGRLAYQLKVWRFERIGWYLLVVGMLLGPLGLFSGKISVTRQDPERG